jgi:hypothetical protein
MGWFNSNVVKSFKLGRKSCSGRRSDRRRKLSVEAF